MLTIDTPNKLISLRFILGYSQAQLASKLGWEEARISRMERSKIKISHYCSLALLGLLYEESDSYPGYLECYCNLDCDAYVEFLSALSVDGYRMGPIKRCKCVECGSEHLDVYRHLKAHKYWYVYRCQDCGHKGGSLRLEQLSLARQFHMRSKRKINLFSKRWYRKS